MVDYMDVILLQVNVKIACMWRSAGVPTIQIGTFQYERRLIDKIDGASVWL